jgi:hypothetical protein
MQPKKPHELYEPEGQVGTWICRKCGKRDNLGHLSGSECSGSENEEWTDVQEHLDKFGPGVNFHYLHEAMSAWEGMTASDWDFGNIPMGEFGEYLVRMSDGTRPLAYYLVEWIDMHQVDPKKYFDQRELELLGWSDLPVSIGIEHTYAGFQVTIGEVEDPPAAEESKLTKEQQEALDAMDLTESVLTEETYASFQSLPDKARMEIAKSIFELGIVIEKQSEIVDRNQANSSEITIDAQMDWIGAADETLPTPRWKSTLRMWQRTIHTDDGPDMATVICSQLALLAEHAALAEESDYDARSTLIEWKRRIRRALIDIDGLMERYSVRSSPEQ